MHCQAQSCTGKSMLLPQMVIATNNVEACSFISTLYVTHEMPSAPTALTEEQ